MNLRKVVGHSPLIQAGASVIVVDKDNRILLQKRSDTLEWGYSGGSIEIDESVEDTAIRELEEETGLVADEIELFGIFSGKAMHYTYPNGDEVSNIDHVYVCKKYHGELKNQLHEVEDLKFFSKEDYPSNIFPANKIALDKWIKENW